jgi:hypothetical protein
MSEEDNEKTANEPLTTRETAELLFRDPAVRSYTYAALGALAMVFVVLFMNGSDIGAVLVVLLASAGLVLRWIAAPPLVLVVVCYFQLFPFGAPFAGFETPFEVRDSHFRVIDAVLTMAVLVYLRCQYRIFGLVQQAMPFENVLRRGGEGPVRRPASHIEPGEVGWLLGVAGGIVVVGQLAWWLVNSLEFTPNEEFPIRWSEGVTISTFGRTRPRSPGEFSPGAHRFFAIVGLLFFGTLLARLVFGYWRLRMMNAAEGSMVLANTSWAESHRERVRTEKWRIWGRRRAAEQAKEAERAERERERDEERRRDRRPRGRTGRGKR